MNLHTRVVAVASLLFVTGCPTPMGSDAGTGGGSASGGGTAGGSSTGGGAGGGSVGGGSAGGGTGTGGGSTTVALADLCAAYQAASCAYYVRCGGYSSSAVCSTFLPPGGGCPTEQIAGLDAGRVHYDGAKAKQCFDASATATCNGNPAQTGTCSEIFVGQVPVNGACGYDFDCVPTAFCKGNGVVCGGTCTAKIAIGSPIAYPDECVDGAYVVDGFCAAPQPLGASCDYPDGGSGYLPCAQPGSCRTYVFDDGGRPGDFCARGGLVGEPCQDLDAGIQGCSAFTQCNPQTHQCSALSGPGVPCDRANFGNQCQYDLWCNGTQTSPTCQPFSGVGGPCTQNYHCGRGICDGGQSFNLDGGPWPVGQCFGTPALNQPCLDTCADGLYCDQGHTSTCLPLKANGAPCDGTFQCASYECSGRDAGYYVCGTCE